MPIANKNLIEIELVLKIYILQVCPNGIVCFKRRYESYTIPFNREFKSDLRNVYCLAPYFSDIILNNAGKVWYQAYDALSPGVSESSEVVSVQQLVHETYAVEFSPVFMFKATWDQAKKYGGFTSEVCIWNQFAITI